MNDRKRSPHQKDYDDGLPDYWPEEWPVLEVVRVEFIPPAVEEGYAWDGHLPEAKTYLDSPFWESPVALDTEALLHQYEVRRQVLMQIGRYLPKLPTKLYERCMSFLTQPYIQKVQTASGGYIYALDEEDEDLEDDEAES